MSSVAGDAGQRRSQRSLRPSSGASVAVVCHGNIARSQVFAHFLDARARACQVPLAVSSCGVAEEAAYAGWEALLAETERRLVAATPPSRPAPQLTRNYWTPQVAEQLRGAKVILAADASIKADLNAKLGAAAPPILLFYELSKGVTKDFVDT